MKNTQTPSTRVDPSRGNTREDIYDSLPSILISVDFRKSKYRDYPLDLPVGRNVPQEVHRSSPKGCSTINFQFEKDETYRRNSRVRFSVVYVGQS